MEYRIGDFAIVTQNSIKVLRRYHTDGLLVPSRVDEETGYRFYDQSLIERARAITMLRNWNFTLREVGEILRDYQDDEMVIDVLDRKRAELKVDIRRLKGMEKDLSMFIAREKEYENMKNEIEFVVKNIPEMPIVVTTYSGDFTECGPAIGRVYRTAGSRAAGPCFSRYSAEEGHEKEDVEVCLPVKSRIEREEVEYRILEAARVISIIHEGPYDRLGDSYRRLVDYRQENGLSMNGPWREIYIKGPGMIFRRNPDKYITELQMPVA